MKLPVHHLVTLAALTLAIGFVTGAASLVLAHDESMAPPDICTTTASAFAEEAPFLAENDAAMKKMMADMAIKPTGDVDGDFVAMMVPHHQGAIDMAQAVLRYGRNEQIRRIAQEIIVEQQQEIAAMRLASASRCRPPCVADRTSSPTADADFCTAR